MQYAVGYQSTNGHIIALTESTAVRDDAEAEMRSWQIQDPNNEFFVVERPCPLWKRSEN